MRTPAGTATADATTSGNFDLPGLTAVLGLLTQAGGVETSARRPDPLHVGYAEAARRLNIPEKWLREHIGALPHRKMGKFVGFTEDDLRAISEMHFVGPAAGAHKAIGTPQRSSSLTPSKRNRSRSRSHA
ncbi:hypothetical protein [Streptomyces mexicanus]|jgi:hypothetical protein|uniref:hypothetical protein n=1 Tax=Streptomyces mexicanus TaxID=178566 RepID=UPI0031F0FB66